MLIQSETYHSFNYILDEKQIENIEMKLRKIYAELMVIQDFDKKKHIIEKWSTKILGKSKKLEDFILAETQLESDMLDRRKKAFQIMLPRLAYFGSLLVTNPSSAETFETFLLGFVKLNSHSNKQLVYNLPQVFNATRALIDNATSAKRAEIYVQNQNSHLLKLTTNQQQIFSDVLTFYRKTVLPSPLMRNSLETVIQSDNNYSNLKIEDMIEEMNKMPISFVQDVHYSGMVHLGGIFINGKTFFNYSGGELFSFLLMLLIHEGFHYCMRHLKQNFAWQTPEGTGLYKGLEGGFLLENLIWGDYKKAVWKLPNIVSDSQRWNTFRLPKKCLFNTSEIESLEERDVEGGCSGLCSFTSDMKII